jgi:hypothetical protein
MMFLSTYQKILEAFVTEGAFLDQRYFDLVHLSLQGLPYPHRSMFLDAATVFYSQLEKTTRIVWAAMYGGARTVDTAFEDLQKCSLLKVIEGRVTVHDVVRNATQSIAPMMEPDRRVWRADQVHYFLRYIVRYHH